MIQPAGRGPGEGTAEPPGSDPGLAAERTALAWTRSALSLAVTAALVARAGLTGHAGALGVIGGAVLAALAVLTWRQGDMLARHPQRHPGPQARSFRLLSAGTLFTAALSLAVAIVV